ncbi:CPBP family intramembrane metalloprotease [Halobellus sp. Atlit-38R]|uniref:type II CAAX endopeptidase family protein n=1 Tax=Halobellus sp. Atlit-38R TaxID=2282131 RepID=UPI000EF1B07C|nr:type II CAAX endopeptidase family protein [Halobellus sp. Atlit-38R]RLM84255.1 CPBP family intramembrane metalloprotease [Halobellus sp. Atlit-38R]
MSSLSHDIYHGVGIARVELRRSLRKSFGTRKRKLAVLGFAALFSPTLFFWGRIAYDAGQAAVRQGELPIDLLGVQLSLLVIVFAVMSALSVVQKGRPEGESLLLTATTPRAVLLGLTIHSTIQLVGFVLFPTVLFAGAFALGTGELSVLLTAVLAVGLLFTVVSVLGTVMGQLVTLALLQSRRFRAASRGFGLLLLVGLIALGYVSVAPLVGETALLAPFTTVTAPATLYLSFVFAGTSFGPAVGVGSLVVMAIALGSIPALLAVAVPLAQRLWFADATPTSLLQRDASTPAAQLPTPSRVGTHRMFPPRTGPKPLSIALGLWTRWLRIPVRFSPLFPLVIVLVMAVVGVLNTPEQLPLVIGGVLVFVGAYVSGGIFGLNPFGEAGEMRTVEFLSSTSSRTLVLGHLFAGLLVGTPVSLLGAVILTVTMGLSAPVALALGALAVVLTIASSGVAVGIGSVLPSRDAHRTYRGYEVATPSQWALITYMFAVLSLVIIAAAGALLVLLYSDPGVQSRLFIVAAGVAAVVLLTIGYGGARIATGRFDEPPYVQLGDESERSLLGRTPSDGGNSSETTTRNTLTRPQQVRGLTLLGAFVVLRAIAARTWNRYFPEGYSTDPVFLGFLAGIFLVLSVGLVYLGFTRWVGVDLVSWWVDRDRLRGDLLWGALGILGVLVVTVAGAIGLSMLFPELTPVGEAGATTAAPITSGTATGWAVNLLLGWFFGFAIAAFQEETLFRGFLQPLLQERYGRVLGIIGQAMVFTLAHLGYYPISAWPLLLVVFLVGLVLAWLVDRRGTLLPAGIAHGFVG